MKKLILVLGLAAIGGCATKQYFHTSISGAEEMDRQRVIDDAYCTQVSMGSVEMPQIIQSPASSRQSSGTISGYNSAGGYSNFTYSGTTRESGSFSRGFANGMNIGSAVAARKARDKIHHGCMLAKGWSDIPTR